MASEKISGILESIKGLSVVELNELVKAIEEEFGVSAQPVVAAAAAPAAGGEAAAAEEKTEFTVKLEDVGKEKIKVIKALRAAISGLSLKDAKEKVDSAPTVIADGVSKEDAEKIKKALEEAGAKVSLS